jgi:thiamine-monophosphate kinase
VTDHADIPVGQIDEFALIDRLVGGRPPVAGVPVGPGDDAAVVDAPDGRVAVSTDMLVGGRHFRLDWSTPHEVGRKAIAQNAADIEAIGGRSTAFVVAFGAPVTTPVGAVRQLNDGMWQEAATVGAAIVGGDLVASPHWVISVTVLGDLGGRAPVLRSGAKPGSVLAVCGTLGRSAAGLQLLRRGVGGFDDLTGRHRVPRPPYGQGRAAAESGALAMIDVSDGLLADAAHLASASDVVIDLSRDALGEDVAAVAEAARACHTDPWPLVLAGGEDHALLGCFPGRVPPGWRVIGAVRAGKGEVLVDGRPWAGPTGWQSFGG